MEVVKLSKIGHIVAEATKQFNRVGYYDTRLEDIAESLNKSKTSISYYFKSKELLLSEVYSNACSFTEQAIETARSESLGLDKVLCYIDKHLRAHEASQRGEKIPPLALMNDLSGLGESGHAEISQRYQAHVRNFQSFINDGLNDGSIHVQSKEATTFFAFNAIQCLPQWLDSIPERSRESNLKGFIDLMRKGLCGEPQQFRASTVSPQIPTFTPDAFDREARNRMKREAILRTGVRYLNRNGYRNLSLDAIAAELGVTRGTFYYHIEDKEAFLMESFERTCDLIEQALKLAGPEEKSHSGLVKIERMIRWLFERHVTELDPLLRLNLINLLSKPRRAAITARINRLRASIAELVAEGMLDGSIREIELDNVEYIILGLVFSASGRRFAATQLAASWHPHSEPITASAAYFEPLISGFWANSLT